MSSNRSPVSRRNAAHPLLKEIDMPIYHLTWEIDIDASSPREAAEKALAIQRDQGSIATVFDVVDEGGDSVRIDLEESSEDAL
jgi:hypothetical protein